MKARNICVIRDSSKEEKNLYFAHVIFYITRFQVKIPLVEGERREILLYLSFLSSPTLIKFNYIFALYCRV